MSKNEVATIDPHKNIPSTQCEAFDNGLGELTTDDMIVPRLKIDKNNGEMYLNVSKEDTFTSANIAILRLKKSRILWPSEYDADNEPLCKSSDFVKPDSSIEKPMCDTCELMPKEAGEKRAHHKCQYANWTSDKKGKNKAPECKETWNLLVVDLDSYVPMIMSLASTRLPAAKSVLNKINLLSRAKNLPACAYKMALTTKKEETPKGDVFIPVFSDVTLMDKEEVSNMTQIMQELAGVQLAGTDQDDFVGESSDSGSPAGKKSKAEEDDF